MAHGSADYSIRLYKPLYVYNENTGNAVFLITDTGRVVVEPEASTSDLFSILAPALNTQNLFSATGNVAGSFSIGPYGAIKVVPYTGSTYFAYFWDAYSTLIPFLHFERQDKTKMLEADYAGNLYLAGALTLGSPLAVAHGGTGTTTGSITGTGALTFAAGGTNQNVTLTPSGTGHIVVNGRLGVGTSGPNFPIDIQLSGNAFTQLGISNTTSGTSAGAGLEMSLTAAHTNNLLHLGVLSAGFTSDGLLVPNAAFMYSYGQAAGLNIFTYDSYDLTLGTGNTARVTIKSGGNVGIGTPTPGSKLAVQGLTAYANNAAAITGGLAAGDFYRTGGDPHLGCVVP